MCLVLFAYKAVPGYRLVLAANRDEFLERPTAPMGFTFDGEEILAGRDLQEGGTWLGIDRQGRLGAITNYRDPDRILPAAPSRGEIIPAYLRAGQPPDVFLADLDRESQKYNGFNLLLASDKLVYYSNITRQIAELAPGYYGLSNHLLDTPWHKVKFGKTMFNEVLAGSQPFNVESLFEILANTSKPADEFLPDTGVGLEWERLLSPLFIHSLTYGTRSSTVVTLTEQGEVFCEERSYLHGQVVRECGRVHYTFQTIP